MKYNLGLSLVTGLIIGAILGCIFYLIPAKFLICGPLPTEIIWLPPGYQSFIWEQTFYWGIIPGLIIGFLGGFNTDATLPRGHFSKGIGVVCYLVCTILAWGTQWEFLSDTSGERIALIVLFTIIMFFASIAISNAVSFIESIRE